ncbi:MAG: peptide deformylase [Gammaproteobacteria bacterium CG22_combo_CG10-13_8_21_14_all_40_8]|nr:MAG: peptide deformylase [Gammaproteobacteria bacterium CG22_combo_CG10-13_8_21_14_all_40_8]
MALLRILEFPDPRLRTIAMPVKQIDEKIVKIAEDMLETMYHAPGIGLAATQVNIHQRIVVIDVSHDNNEPLILINPKIIQLAGVETMEEGCLSFPETYVSVERAEAVTIEALDIEGNLFQLAADGLLAVCIQHEIDHLEGKMLIDYVSPLKRNRIRQTLTKRQRLLEKENDANGTS